MKLILLSMNDDFLLFYRDESNSQVEDIVLVLLVNVKVKYFVY